MKAYTIDCWLYEPDAIVKIYDTDVYAAHPDWAEWRRIDESFIEEKCFEYNSVIEANRWLAKNDICINFYDWTKFYKSHSFNLDGYLRSLRERLNRIRKGEKLSHDSCDNDSDPCAFAKMAEESINSPRRYQCSVFCPFAKHCAPAQGWRYSMEDMNQHNLLWLIQKAINKRNDPLLIEAFLRDKSLHEIAPQYRYCAPARDYSVDYAPQPRDKRGRFMKAVAL